MNFTSFHFTQQQGPSLALLSAPSLSRENGASFREGLPGGASLLWEQRILHELESTCHLKDS